MIELRDYQVDLIGRVRAELRAGKRRVLMQAPTGAGKTAICSTMMANSSSKGYRAWFVCHRVEILEQAYITLTESAGLRAGIVAAGYPRDPRPLVQVCSIDTLRRRVHAMKPPDLLIVDECFPAGTVVGGRPIEYIQAGDEVPAFDHAAGAIVAGRVVRCFRRPAYRLVRIHLSSGRSLVCTPDHPIYQAGAGYTPAASLRYGAAVFRLSGEIDQNHMRALRRAEAFGARPSVHSVQDERPAMEQAAAGRDNVPPVRPADGAGRQESLRGCEKNGVPGIDWVDRIEVLELGSDGRFGGVCPDGHVYNIEVETHHNYFADGVLVHNCHHSISKTWRQLIESFPGAGVIGLTATPERLDGAGLGGLFDALVPGPAIAELIEAGWLSRYRLFAPGSIDLSGVHTTAGDYNKRELSDCMNRSAVMGDALTHYRKYTPGKRAIVFAWSVESSRMLAGQFAAAGIPSAHLDGDMDPAERKRIVNAFRTGAIRVLSNCSIVTEGFDLPSVEAAFILRPTQSTALWLQMVGRCLRPAPGKAEALIFDHAGNCRRHGLPDDERTWTLEGRRRRPKADAECPVKQCPQCFAMVPAAAGACRHCGLVFQAAPRELEQIEGELAEVDLEAERRARLREQGRAESIEDLVRVGVARGYRNAEGWARHVWAGRQAKRAAVHDRLRERRAAG